MSEQDNDWFKGSDGASLPIYDLTVNNIESDEYKTPRHKGGVIANDVVYCGGEVFYTQIDGGLRHLLDAIRSMRTYKGNLKFWISEKYVPFAAIVCIYHSFYKNVECSPEMVLATYKELQSSCKSAEKLDVDHLCENKGNNYVWALALMPHGINGGLNNRRSKIKAPYFFYTVYDLATRHCKVRCGVETESGCWEKSFCFEWGNPRKSAQQYYVCFLEFWDRLPVEYRLEKSDDSSWLHYWAKPERAQDERNPLIQLLHKPLNSFEQYSAGALADLPVLQ